MNHEVNVRFLGVDKTKPVDEIKSHQLERLAFISKRLDENHDKVNLTNIGILLTGLEVALHCHNIDLALMLSDAENSTALIGLGVKESEDTISFAARLSDVSGRILYKLSEEALPLGGSQ